MTLVFSLTLSPSPCSFLGLCCRCTALHVLMMARQTQFVQSVRSGPCKAVVAVRDTVYHDVCLCVRNTCLHRFT